MEVTWDVYCLHSMFSLDLEKFKIMIWSLDKIHVFISNYDLELSKVKSNILIVAVHVWPNMTVWTLFFQFPLNSYRPIHILFTPNLNHATPFSLSLGHTSCSTNICSGLSTLFERHQAMVVLFSLFVNLLILNII